MVMASKVTLTSFSGGRDFGKRDNFDFREGFFGGPLFSYKGQSNQCPEPLQSNDSTLDRALTQIDIGSLGLTRILDPNGTAESINGGIIS